MKSSILLQNSNVNTDCNFINYIDYLTYFRIEEFSESGFFLNVGKPESEEGWIIHISVSKIQFEKLISTLFPYLILHSHPFSIPQNSHIHEMLQLGYFGYINLGKIITIYPNSSENILILVKELILLTEGLTGPAIPTDYPLGNLIYSRYGSYKNGDVKYILNSKGEMIQDIETIPFQLHSWIEWPFESIKPLLPIKENKIINDRYLIRQTLKNDLKGFVMVAIYQKNIFSYKKCILKEGKIGMGLDDWGRDMESRLFWQKELHIKLHPVIPIPKYYDFFKDKENQNTYLSIEYIKGKSIKEFLEIVYEGNSWNSLNLKAKFSILDTLNQVIEIVKELHLLGYVHRDLNIENFLITPIGKVYIIDLELAYDLHNNNPSPPYEKGTEGYMSPEQNIQCKPTFEQDIYSIGAIILACISNQTPYRFNPVDNEAFLKNLQYFVNDYNIAVLISNCLHIDHAKRPSLIQIQESLSDFKMRITPNETLNYKPIDIFFLKGIIENALKSLITSPMINQLNLWSSPVSIKEKWVGNIRLDHTVYLGFRKGISGILYLIGKLGAVGFDVEDNNNVLKSNIVYLDNILVTNPKDINYGLFSGMAGVALGIHSLMVGGKIPLNNENIQYIINCFDNVPIELDIANGISGFGLALIKCRNELPIDFVTKKLKLCVNYILKNQSSNGSWKFVYGLDNNPIVLTSFNYGIAGVIYFLLNAMEIVDVEELKVRILLALKYLIKHGKSYKDHIVWPLANGSKEINEFSNGGYNLLLPFIKAYTLTKRNIYKKIAEDVLYSYPAEVTADFISQERGISGLGEVYLEAWEAFDNFEWLLRAEWIAGALMHSRYNISEKSYWLEHDPFRPNADLLTGNSGIIHFLLRIYCRKKITHIFN